MEDKLSLRGAWSRHVTHFNFSPPKISLERLKLVLQILYSGWPCEVLAFGLTSSLSSGRVITFWEIIVNISEMVQYTGWAT